MNVLVLKLCVGTNRAETRVSKMIKINKDNARLYYGFAAGIVDSYLEWNLVVNT